MFIQTPPLSSGSKEVVYNIRKMIGSLMYRCY